FLLLTGISALVNASDYGRYFAGLYDTEVHLSDPIFEHNSDRSLHGDGYSISVHKLPSSIRKRFASADEKLFAEFPERPNYRNNWNIERWRQSPMDEQFQDHLDFALTSTGYNTEDSSELRKHFETIRAALKREGTFYAFFYSGQVSNIDFF